MQLVAEAEVPAALSVVVEPASTDDWEMMEQNADYMEAQILTQVRAHISAVLALCMTTWRALPNPSLASSWGQGNGNRWHCICEGLADGWTRGFGTASLISTLKLMPCRHITACVSSHRGSERALKCLQTFERLHTILTAQCSQGSCLHVSHYRQHKAQVTQSSGNLKEGRRVTMHHFLGCRDSDVSP